MIIFRYLTREIASTLSAISALLLLIFLSNQFVRFLSQAATGKFATSMLIKLLAIEIPHLLILLLPLGLFLSIVLTYGRLYAESEMTVLFTSGLSRKRLVQLTLPIILTVTIIVALLSLWITPQLLTYRGKLLAQTGTAIELQAALPGRFQETEGGRRIFYVERMSADKEHMESIFMAQLEDNNETTENIPPWTIITAHSGYQMIDNKTGDRFFVTENGQRYQGLPGQKNFSIVQFERYGIRIESHASALANQEQTISTWSLWRHPLNLKAAYAELQWRFAMPLSVLILGLLAIPLSRVKPRHGRYGQLLPAILIYTLYVNCLLMGRNWIGQGVIHYSVGLWWVHGLLLIMTGIIAIHQIGWRDCWLLFKKRWHFA